ncbi:MAG: ATP-binding cassette domain-containing protein, partial [Fibrobacteraceae bacterium]|nr:ATP-binding cassette domain-containing protein [Fibrobacteraceae bacterium]
MPNNKSVVFSAQNVSKTFGAGKNLKTAVDNVSFDIYDGEIISIVGGSGCGKSVLAKIMLGLYQPSNGTFLYRDHQIKNLKNHWNEVQSVFQDPFSCFNQFFSIRSQLEDSLNILKDKPSKEEVKARVDAGLLAVNVKPSDIEGKYPFELSGGQMQRMLLARIFA